MECKADAGDEAKSTHAGNHKNDKKKEMTYHSVIRG